MKKYIRSLFSWVAPQDLLFAFLAVIWPVSGYWGHNLIKGEVIAYDRAAATIAVVFLATITLAFLTAVFLPTRFRRPVFWLVSFLSLANLAYMQLVTAYESVTQDIDDTSIWFTAPLQDARNMDAAYLVFLAGASLAVWFLARKHAFRIVTVSVLAALSCFNIAYGFLVSNHRLSSDYEIQLSTDALVTPPPAITRRPNVYYFVVDGHPWFDILQSVYHTDSSEFVRIMRDKDFYIAEKAYSNYPVTTFSLAGTFGMEYHARDIPGDEKKVLSDSLMAYLHGNSPATTALRNRGYNIAWSDNGFKQWTYCWGGDVYCVPRKAPGFISSQEVFLFRTTALFNFIKFYTSWRSSIALMFETEQEIDWLSSMAALLSDQFLAFLSFNPTDVSAMLEEMPDSPRFFFGHFKATHNPSANKDCRFQISINVKVSPPHTTVATQHFSDYVICLHKQLREMADAIIAADPDAIIVIQADHGTNGMYGSENFMRQRPASEWDKVDVDELFGVLSMFRLPRECRDQLYPEISNVNTFRVILSCIDGVQHPMLPDISYAAAYQGWMKHYNAVQKFTHGPEQNYPDRSPNRPGKYGRSLATLDHPYLAAVHKLRRVHSEPAGASLASMDAGIPWQIKANVTIPTSDGPWPTPALAIRFENKTECRALAEKANGPTAGNYVQGINIPAAMWTSKNSAVNADLTYFGALANRMVGCVETMDGKFILYAAIRIPPDETISSAENHAADTSLLPYGWQVRTDTRIDINGEIRPRRIAFTASETDDICLPAHVAKGRYTAPQGVNMTHDTFRNAAGQFGPVDLTPFARLKDQHIDCIMTLDKKYILYKVLD